MPTPVKSLPSIAPGRGRKVRPEYATAIDAAVSSLVRGAKVVTLDEDDLKPLEGLMQNRKGEVIEVSQASKNAGLRAAAARVSPLTKGKHAGHDIFVSFRGGETSVAVAGLDA